MNKQEDVQYLFGIAKEIKRSFENPVILLTFNDYADNVYKSMLNMRAAVLNNAHPKTIADIVNDFHLVWLQAVHDLEEYRKSLIDKPLNTIINAIEFTIECIESRIKCFKTFIEPLKASMITKERLMIQADIEIMREMKDTVKGILLGKLQCFSQLSDKTEQRITAADEVEELLNWVDLLNDHLTIQISKLFYSREPALISKLSSIKQQNFTDVRSNTELNVTENCFRKERHLSTMSLASIYHELEIQKVIEKIKQLGKRLHCLQKQNSSAARALHYKTSYLEERLQSLKDLRMYLMNTRSEQKEKNKSTKFIVENELYMFNHNLPHFERCQLIEQLLNIWYDFIYKHEVNVDRLTMIDILGTSETNKNHTDFIGTFTIDKYGRKLYRKENDDVIYQKTENDELVPLNDDQKHVYFYDEIGRYYLDEKSQRIYKAIDSTCEYVLKRDHLSKVKEERNGIQFCFDNFGMYYSRDGKRVYIDPDNIEEYEYDSIGHIVRIRPETTVYEVCPVEPIVTEDSKYIKQTVGTALKLCILDVILKQPTDPIRYLAENLTKYRHNIEIKQKKECEEKEMLAARKLYLASTVQEVEQTYEVEGEDSKGDLDVNFVSYKTMEI